MIHIQNINDNKCFEWRLFRYLHPADHHPARIRKAERLFGDKLDSEDIKFPIKIEDIHKIEKKLSTLVFLGYENKVKYPIYVSKYDLKKNTLIYY